MRCSPGRASEGSSGRGSRRAIAPAGRFAPPSASISRRAGRRSRGRSCVPDGDRHAALAARASRATCPAASARARPVDSRRGQCTPWRSAATRPAHQQRRTRIEQHDVAPSTASPAQHASMIAAFWAASPPLSSALAADIRPKADESIVACARRRSNVVGDASAVERQLVDAGAVDDEGALRAQVKSTWATLAAAVGSATPITWRRTPGRVGHGAQEVERRRHAKLCDAQVRRDSSPGGSSAQRGTRSRRSARTCVGLLGRRSIGIPSASSTSAEPGSRADRPIAVLGHGHPRGGHHQRGRGRDLNVRAPSPPVPHVSIAPVGAVTGRTRWRMARAKPDSSSAVSPRMRRASKSPASWAGVATPSITSPMAERASSCDKCHHRRPASGPP